MFTTTDGALDYFGAYLQAYLNSYTPIAFHSAFPGVQPVATVYTHDPRKFAFNERDLPALYLFREKSLERPTDIGQDYRINYDNVVLLWVFPTVSRGPQETARVRYPWASGLVKAIDHAIERMRDPCYVAPGDTDPTAPLQGSLVFLLAKVDGFRVMKWERAQIEIDTGRPGERRHYDAIAIGCEMQERLEILPDLFDTPYGIDVLIEDADGVPLTEIIDGP